MRNFKVNSGNSVARRVGGLEKLEQIIDNYRIVARRVGGLEK